LLPCPKLPPTRHARAWLGGPASLHGPAFVMQKAAFHPLQLPSSVPVPLGAIDHTPNPDSLCFRSLHTTPLKRQVVSLLETKLIVDAELSEGSTDVEYTSACVEGGLLHERMYKRHHDEHPAHLAGLAAAGDLILQSGSALLMDAVGAYLSAKQSTLLRLHYRFGESVYVPALFATSNFMTDFTAAVRTWRTWRSVGGGEERGGAAWHKR
jgi:hypothetical protein